MSKELAAEHTFLFAQENDLNETESQLAQDDQILKMLEHFEKVSNYHKQNGICTLYFFLIFLCFLLFFFLVILCVFLGSIHKKKNKK